MHEPTYASPLDAAIGLAFVGHDGDGRSELRLDPTPQAVGTEEPRMLHGGTLATCVDTAAWHAVRRARPGPWVAVDLRVDYLRPARGEALRVRGRCLRAGRTLAAADVEIEPWDEPGRLVAVGRAQFVRTGD